MAQEVHGVETKMVCTYDCNPNGSWDGWWISSDYHCPYFGYEFTNLNSIPVSVEVELYEKRSIEFAPGLYRPENVLLSTKSFVLKSGESYVFKTSEKGICTYYNCFSSGSYSDYYVKYKAYKLL